MEVLTRVGSVSEIPYPFHCNQKGFEHILDRSKAAAEAVEVLLKDTRRYLRDGRAS